MPATQRAMRILFAFAFVSVALAGCSCETPIGSVDVGPDGGGLDAPNDTSTSDGGALDGGRCIAADVQLWTLDNYDDVSVRYRARIRPDVEMRPFDLYLEFNRYGDTTYTGTFPLGEGHDANFGGCAHCVAAFYGTMISRGYFASAGTLTLNADPFDLRLDAVLENVTLIEVTIEGEALESVPVPNGRCITFDRIEVSRAFAPPGWTCNDDEYGDGAECDCNCGIVDSDCYAGLPVVGCAPGQLCVGRPREFEFVPTCVDDCDREAGVMCPGTGVCVDDSFGDLCEGDAARVDRTAGLGDTCADGAVFCAVAGSPGGPGIANGYCDVFDRADGRCAPRCSVDADCDVAAFERCYTLGASGPAGEEVFFGFCGPRYPVGWTCRGDTYEDGVTCDCNCGVRDSDCYDPSRPIAGCAATESCLPDGSCAPIPANDTCASALPLSIGTTTGSTTGGVNDYTFVRDAGGCIAVEEDGPDVVYAVDVAAGQTLTVVGRASFNLALYLIGPGAPTVCDRTSTACVAGVEATSGTDPETLVYTATTSGTYYLVVDAFFFEFMGDFTLETTLE